LKSTPRALAVVSTIDKRLGTDLTFLEIVQHNWLVEDRRPIMSTIPISLTEEQFNEHVNPYLSKAKRGYVCRIPLYKIFNYILYRLHTGCQWERLPIEADPQNPKNKEISWQAVYYLSGFTTS